MVLFDVPIGRYCGLVVKQAYPIVGADWGTNVSLVGCDEEQTLYPRTLFSVSYQPLSS